MLTQTRGTEDVIRCHMVLSFRGGESGEQRSSVLHQNGTLKKQFEEVKERRNGTDRWIKINTGYSCIEYVYIDVYGWINHPSPKCDCTERIS